MSGPAPFGRRLARFASFNVGQQIWLALLSLAATPVLYHRLGPSAYGLLAVVNLVAAQLAILEFGFGHATIRRLARDGAGADVERASRTLSTSAWVFLATAAAGGALLLGATDLLAERYFRIPAAALDTGRAALRIGAAFFAVSMLSMLLGAAWQGLQRFGWLNLVSGVAATAQLLGSVALVVAGLGVLHVLVWSVVVGVGALLAHVARLRRHLPGVRILGRPDREAFREMAGFGFLLMVAGALTQLYLSGGPLLLGHYVAVGVLPFFTVPFGLFQRLNRMGYGLASALYPLVAEMDGTGDEPSKRRLFTSGTRILLVAGAAAAAPGIVLARPFLTLWMGADFALQAVPVLEALLAAFAISLATVPSVELARGTGRAGLLVAYTAVLASVCLAGVSALAPAHGAAGAGWAFLLAQGAGSAVMVAAVGRRDCGSLMSPRLAVFLLLAAVGVALALASGSSPAMRALWAGSLAVVLPGMGLGWTLDPEERRTLRRIVRRP